jgi:hypothetical protein
MRPFEPGVDDEQAVSVVRTNRRNFVRVTTDTLRSGSWDEAYQDAIRLMRDIDQAAPVT